MKCRKCNDKAVINMRQHKLALCKTHFLEWIPEKTERFIRLYSMFQPEEKILVAVSGGKDSLALWEILTRLGYQADGLYINLGINEGLDYSDQSYDHCVKFASTQNLKLITINLKERYQVTIPELSKRTNRGKLKPCSVCGLTKRHIMNRIAIENKYDILATGHNLDDEAATLFGNTMNWIPGYLSRQSPVLEADLPGFTKKAKPLFRFYEKEIASNAYLRGIEYIHIECPFSKGAKSIYYKGILNQMESHQPGTKLQYYLSFLRAKQTGLFSQKGENSTASFSQCIECGSPTTAPGVCTFCRLLVRRN